MQEYAEPWCVLDRAQPEDVAAGQPECGFWRHSAPKRVLEYAVTAAPPLPAEAVAFLRGHAPGRRSPEGLWRRR